MIDLDHYVYKLPYTISSEEQQSIIDCAYQYSNSWSGQVQFWADGDKTYDQGNDYFGRVQIRGITDESLARFKDKYAGVSLNWINWACRLDPETEWEWKDTPVTETVKNLMSRIDHLFVSVHRVLLLVQKVGSTIPLHTDKVIKTQYDEGYFAPGPAAEFNIEGNDFHRQNKYLALKWPLTDTPGNNGKPVIEVDGKKYIYDVGQNLFAINEVEILHGADAVEHRRGVIFIDGIFDWNEFDKIKREKVSFAEVK